VVRKFYFFYALRPCGPAPCGFSFLFYVAAPGRDAKGPRRALALFISPVFKEVLFLVSFEIVIYLGFSHLVSLDPGSFVRSLGPVMRID